jgi:hypothetical protein
MSKRVGKPSMMQLAFDMAGVVRETMLARGIRRAGFVIVLQGEDDTGIAFAGDRGAVPDALREAAAKVESSLAGGEMEARVLRDNNGPGTRVLRVEVDEADYQAIIRAISARQAQRVDGQPLLPEGQGDLRGRYLAEACRGYVEMLRKAN